MASYQGALRKTQNQFSLRARTSWRFRICRKTGIILVCKLDFNMRALYLSKMLYIKAFSGTQACLILLCFADTEFYRVKGCGNPELRSLSVTFFQQRFFTSCFHATSDFLTAIYVTIICDQWSFSYLPILFIYLPVLALSCGRWDL